MALARLSPHRRHLLFGSLAVALALAAVGALTAAGVFEAWERTTLDWRARLLPLTPPKDELLLAYIDQKSIDHFARREGITWPWPRQLYAPALRFLHRSGARAVIVDLLFSEPSVFGLSDDEALAAAVRESGPVVLAAYFRGSYGGGSSPKLPAQAALAPTHSDPPEVARALDATIPLQTLVSAAARIGNVSAEPDDDGVYRRIPLVVRYGERLVPTLALAGAIAATGKEPAWEGRSLRLGGARLPIGPDGSILLRFPADRDAFPAVSLADLILSEARLRRGMPPLVEPSKVRGRVVLLGAVAPGLYDLKPTPVSAVAPGLFIHATAVSNLLAGRALAPLRPSWTLAAVTLAALALAAAGLAIPSPGRALLCYFAVALGWAAVTLVAFKSDLSVPLVGPEAAFLLVFGAAASVSYATVGRQRRWLKGAFQRYVAPSVVSELIHRPEGLALGGERRRLTLLCADLEGFSAIAETLPPEELVAFLNRHLEALSRVVLEHRGTLDKYLGDAVMAFWGAPGRKSDNHAEQACRAALACAESLSALDGSGPPAMLGVRIAVHTGDMVVGNIGSAERLDYTVVGDNVNLAFRLEALNKRYGTSCLVSEATVCAVGEGFVFRELDRVRVAGRVEPVTIYELVGSEETVEETTREALAAFGRGLAAYRARAFGRAAKEFQEVLGRLPEDGPSSLLLQRCRALAESPPPPTWDGITTFEEK